MTAIPASWLSRQERVEVVNARYLSGFRANMSKW